VSSSPYYFSKPGARTREEREHYQATMLELLEDRNNWSAARYWCHLSILIQIFNVLFILVVAIALTIYGLRPDADHSYEFKEALVYCSLAILVSYLWLLMRAAFNHQKLNYFPEISNWIAEVSVMGLSSSDSLVILPSFKAADTFPHSKPKHYNSSVNLVSVLRLS
jgi:hypothetical protein